MPNWKKVIVSGSDAVLNSITVTDTANFLDNSVTIEGNIDTVLEVAGDISASGNLYIEGLAYDSTPLTDGVVVYDTANGRFYYTGSYSSGSGGTDSDWKEFNNYITSSRTIIITGSISASEGGSFLAGGVTITDGAAAEIFVDGNITASGNISASGHLFATTSNSAGNYNSVVVVDTASGQFYYTGSYGSGGGGADTDWKEFPTYLSSSKDIKVTGSVYASSSLNAGTNIFAGEEGFSDDEGGIYYSNGVPLLFHGEDVNNPGPIRNYFAGQSNVSESLIQGTPLTLRSNNVNGAATDKEVAPHRVFVSGSLRLKPYGTQEGILELEALVPSSGVSSNQPATTFQNIIAPESGSNFISGIARATGSIGRIETYGGGATSAFTSFGTSFVNADGLSQVAIAKFPVARTKSLRVNSVSMEVENPSNGKKGLFIFPGFSWIPNNDTGWISTYNLYLDEGLLTSNGIEALTVECGYGPEEAAAIGNFTLYGGQYSVGSSDDSKLFDSDGNLNFGNDGTYTYFPNSSGNTSAGGASYSSPLSLVKNETTGDLCLIFYTHEYYAILNQVAPAAWVFTPPPNPKVLAITFTINYESTDF